MVEPFEWLSDRRHNSKLFALNRPDTRSLKLPQKIPPKLLCCNKEIQLLNSNYIRTNIQDSKEEIIQEENRMEQFVHPQRLITYVVMEGILHIIII